MPLPLTYKYLFAYTERSDDVAYQDRPDDTVSNRSLLANALESVAQHEVEKQKLQEYKTDIERMEGEERKLSELNEKIKALSFTKGPRDTKTIRTLQDEARKTANRINNYDKRLLRLEASAPLQKVLEREKKAAYKRAEQKGNEALEYYRVNAEARQNEILRDYRETRAAMRGKESDVALMENEFLRLAKEYESVV